MARRTRRRPRLTWLAANDQNTFETFGSVSTPDLCDLNAFPLIEGKQYSSDSNVAAFLGTAVGTGTPGFTLLDTPAIALKRVVGQFFTSAVQNESVAKHGIVTFCIFKDKVDQNGALANLEAWNPYSSDSDRKRFLFRRSWILQNESGAIQAGSDINSADWPHSNVEYGDVRSGPYIDCKMKTTIAYDENLFGLIATLRVGDPPGDQRFYAINSYKFRILAQLRANRDSY